MASATATARADPAAPREGKVRPGRRPLIRFGGSRLGGFILALNLFGFLVLLGGALALNEWSQGLIEARKESLRGQAELLANVLSDKEYTTGEPEPQFNLSKAPTVFRDIFIKFCMLLSSSMTRIVVSFILPVLHWH